MISDTKNALVAAWNAFTRAFPTSFDTVHGEMEIFGAGIGVPLFNLAFPKSNETMNERDFLRLRKDFSDILAPRGVPGLLFVRTDLVELTGEVEPMVRMPGMVAGELFAPMRDLGKLDIREVEGTEMAAEIARLNVQCHGLHPEDAIEMTCEELWRAPNHGYLLYADGTAVAAGAATFVEGISYIGWMATHSAYRQRGYAEGLLRHMDGFMRRRYGVKESVLHATAMGRPVYERIGYRSVDEFSGYLCGAAASAANA